MAIRLSGMTSGLDTDSIVKAMVSSYTTRKEKYQKAQTKLEWTQDAWKSLNTKVYSLYSNISNLRFFFINMFFSRFETFYTFNQKKHSLYHHRLSSMSFNKIFKLNRVNR